MNQISPEGAIATRIDQIRQTIPSRVRLIAVTKQVPAEVMRLAYAAGIRDFGESRIQEAAAKQAELQDLQDVTWHMIGHLQTNKATRALELFSWIHSVDSLKLALRLNELAKEKAISLTTCLQVKLRSDPNKFGWTTDELITDLPALDRCPHLNIVGLMIIPPYGLETEETLAIFTEAAQFADHIRQQHWQHIKMEHLSMGMSEDYPLAIQAGATMIRLGRVLFGARET